MSVWYNINKEGERSPSKEKENKMYINNYEDIVNHVQTAVGDMSYCEFMQEEYASEIKEAKRNGVLDLKEWLAGEIYNDAETVNNIVERELWGLIIKFDEDPENKAVWAKHIAEVNKLMPHVKLK